MVILLDDGLNVLPPLGFGVDPETGLDDIATPTAIEPDPDATADAAEFEAQATPKKRTRRTKTSASAASAAEAETPADSPEAVDDKADDTTGEETE